MEEPVVKYAAVLFIVLSGVTFVYMRHHNMSVVITSTVSCTSGCKQTPDSGRKQSALQKRCICETCFCHLLHKMIRFLHPIIQWLTSILKASDVYLATLQEKFVDDEKENFAFVSKYNTDEVENAYNNVCNNETKNSKNDESSKKTCPNCEQRGITCDSTCPRRETQKTENAHSSNAANTKSPTPTNITSRVDCDKCNVQGCPKECLKAKVNNIPSTSNNARCTKCAAQNIECLEGCPGDS